MVKIIWLEVNKEGKDVEKVITLNTRQGADDYIEHLKKQSNFIDIISVDNVKGADW
jgi:hypothetical protein